MMYRVLAGLVPMILGWMIWSGAIPVRQWMFGRAVPAPEQVVRQAAQASEASGERRHSASPELDRIVRAQESAMSQAVEADRMMREMERLADNTLETRSRSRSRRASSDDPGWAPTGDWDARR